VCWIVPGGWESIILAPRRVNAVDHVHLTIDAVPALNRWARIVRTTILLMADLPSVIVGNDNPEAAVLHLVNVAVMDRKKPVC